MTTKVRDVGLLGGCAWLVVAGYGLSTATVGSGDDWRLGYAVFSVALLLAAVSTVTLAALVSRHSRRPRLRIAGLVVGGFGCAVAVVAWALPVWMVLLGVGFAMIGFASGTVGGRVLAVLAAAQMMAVAVLIAGIEAEVGRRDEWGDDPAAGGIALMVVAGVTIVEILRMTRDAGRALSPRPAVPADG